MSPRSDSRASPAANSTKLALRTCSMAATRTASLSRCVLRCFGSRFASSALMPSVQTTIPFTCAMARSHVRANTESLHHTSLHPVKPFSRKLMDIEAVPQRSAHCQKRVPGVLQRLPHPQTALSYTLIWTLDLNTVTSLQSGYHYYRYITKYRLQKIHR